MTKTVGNVSVRELRIARTALNLSATAPFNWLGYVIYSPSGNLKEKDGSVPVLNEGGYLGASTADRYAAYYYTVSGSGDGVNATKPFSQTSFMAPSSTLPTSLDLAAFTTFDFALNSPNVTVRSVGNWLINGTMMIHDGTVDIGATGGNVTVKRNFMVGSTGTFKHSTGSSNLTVSGDFNVAGTFLPGTARVTLDGIGPQQLASGTYYDLFIPGTGTKTMTGDITVLSSLNLTGGLLETGPGKVILTPDPNVTSNNVLRETGTGYVRGTVEAAGNVTGPNNYHFSGIGLILTPKVNSQPLGATVVTRLTGGYKTGAAFGLGNNQLSQSILRQFLVQPTVSTGLDYKIIFAYHDTAPSELSYSYVDNSIPKTYVIDENTLEMFRTTDPNSGTWQNLHATTRDAALNTVTVTGITEFTNGNFFTLADQSRPLPVTLTKFALKALPTGVQVNWATASEPLSQGFAVERRSSATNIWQELKFVLSKGSSTQGAIYSYVDASATPGIWYYRLRQRDTDGTETTLPASAIKVSEAAGGLALLARPVPAHEQLTVEGLIPGQPLVVIDAVGRPVLEYIPETASATLNVAGLPPGLYTARTLNGTKALSLRFIKE
ncbi:T9SS type A sorting domain-containing protein [Hymenobacter algoricola]|uniref:T9SS type A sorting domain-containing protein n=1 Tax=Hymenobacter algoricola TaxID=486267 RepID=A0ABP7NHI4_9BACT